MIIKRGIISLLLSLLSLSAYGQKETIAVTIYADDSYPPSAFWGMDTASLPENRRRW